MQCSTELNCYLIVLVLIFVLYSLRQLENVMIKILSFHIRNSKNKIIKNKPFDIIINFCGWIPLKFKYL